MIFLITYARTATLKLSINSFKNHLKPSIHNNTTEVLNKI